MAEEKLNLTEHVDALFEGVEVSDEQKGKFETVLEAAVNSVLSEERAKIQEEIDTKVAELTEAKVEEIETTVGKYVDYAVNEWMESNKVAVESGIKVEMAESFFNGMKELFAEHNVSVPEGKEDVLAEAEAKLAEATDKLNAVSAKNLELAEQIQKRERDDIVAESAEGLTDTQKEKFASLVEGLEAADTEGYREKVKTIRESYFKGSSAAEEPKKLEEEVQNPTEQLSESELRSARLRNPYKFAK